MSHWGEDYRDVGPSVRREDGYLDAWKGRPKISSDPHYVKGYDLGARMMLPTPNKESSAVSDGTCKPSNAPNGCLDSSTLSHEA